MYVNYLFTTTMNHEFARVFFFSKKSETNDKSLIYFNSSFTAFTFYSYQWLKKEQIIPKAFNVM
jgi:hypothetical protein